MHVTQNWPNLEKVLHFFNFHQNFLGFFWWKIWQIVFSFFCWLAFGIIFFLARMQRLKNRWPLSAPHRAYFLSSSTRSYGVICPFLQSSLVQETGNDIILVTSPWGVTTHILPAVRKTPSHCVATHWSKCINFVHKATNKWPSSKVDYRAVKQPLLTHDITRVSYVIWTHYVM